MPPTVSNDRRLIRASRFSNELTPGLLNMAEKCCACSPLFVTCRYSKSIATLRCNRHLCADLAMKETLSRLESQTPRLRTCEIERPARRQSRLIRASRALCASYYRATSTFPPPHASLAFAWNLLRVAFFFAMSLAYFGCRELPRFDGS